MNQNPSWWPETQIRHSSTGAPHPFHSISTLSPHFYHTVSLTLTPGTTSLTDTSYSWQLLMCYPGPLSASHRDWFTDLDGTSAALVAVRCLSVWPLGRQCHSDGIRNGVGGWPCLRLPLHHFHRCGAIAFWWSLFRCKFR